MNDRTMFVRALMSQHEVVRGWLYDPNVSLIGLGWKDRDGKISEGELAIRVHVKRKYSGFELESANTRRVPKNIRGIVTDVVERTYAPQWWFSWRRRPRRTADSRLSRVETMQGGISIGNEWLNDAGTLGALVEDRGSGRRMLLSNSHILSGRRVPQLGQRILQPGTMDGGTRADTVATLTRDAMSDNYDAAVAKLTGNRNLTNSQLGVGSLKGLAQATLGMVVKKSGRTSKVTSGVVRDFHAIKTFPYSGNIVKDVIVIEQYQPFSEVSRGGDSGSVWIEKESNKAVGLHFAGDVDPEKESALAMDMRSVLIALDVALVIDP